MFQHEPWFWEEGRKWESAESSVPQFFHVFLTWVLVWMAWLSLSHISLICFVRFWITSTLLWPSFSSLDANSSMETTLDCPRGFTSFTKSSNFFSSTCETNGDTDLDKRISAYLYERGRRNHSLCLQWKLFIGVYKCKMYDLKSE